jgi:hypothetical protein
MFFIADTTFWKKTGEYNNLLLSLSIIRIQEEVI